ncbi:MAG: carboxypeptidase-like regulatory domain-containing protein [Thermoanaerobaculia bacterium]|nr:carboxypeptidase-like regulatory domain-containing protein [Thermoanaerobaculia bacterium]
MTTVRPIHPILLTAVCVAVVFAAASATGQDDDLPFQSTTIRLAEDTPNGLWVELTPLSAATLNSTERSDHPARLSPEQTSPALTWLPERVAGPAMLCHGVEPAPATDEAETESVLWAVRCDLIAVWHADPESLLPPPDDPVVEISAVTGPPVVGRYLLGDLPVADAVLSVVPARLEAPVPFSLPLIWTDDGPTRRLHTGDDGSFRLPRLAPGDYALQSRLPGGRLHRSESFTVPEIEDLQTNSGSLDIEELVHDLGDIDVRTGVRLEVRASGPDAGPVPGIDVQVRQGATPAELVTFHARTDHEGVAHLDGLAVDKPSVLTCSAPGLATVRQEWDLLPVVVDCDMEPLAAVAGEVLDPDGQPIPGAVVRLQPTDQETAGQARTTATGDDGAFLFADCGAGRWNVEAAAPGYRVRQVELTLEAGERRLLDPLHLLPGREVLVRVSGPGGEPVPGADITAAEPVGSVSARADDDGEARFAHPGPETVLEVSGLEYAAERVRVPAEADGEAARGPFDVTLRPGGWIRVLVELGAATDNAPTEVENPQTPCAGCEIWIQPARQGSSARRHLVTDGRGEALSQPLAPGIYRVQRSRLSHVGDTLVEEPRAEERTVRVVEGEVTTVRFVSGEGLLTVRFAPPPDPGLGPWSLVVSQGNSRRTVPPESDGSFRIDRIRDVTQGLPITMVLERFDPNSAAVAWMRVAELATWPADEAELEVRLPDGSVEGRALRTDTAAANTPASGAQVRLIGFHDFAPIAELRTAPDGSFVVPYLAPGVYSIQIDDLIYTYVSLRPGQTLEVGPLRLAPGVP